jgi:hypothetical protein
MSKTQDLRYIKLCDRVAGKNATLVDEILVSNTDLDITYDDGTFFTLAIRGDSTRIMQELLRYFDRVQLPKLTEGSAEYNTLKYRFKTALEIAVEGENLSAEMKALLSSYIDFEGSECGDLDDDISSVVDTLKDHDYNHDHPMDQRQPSVDSSGSHCIPSDVSNSSNHSIDSNALTQGLLTQLLVATSAANNHTTHLATDDAAQHCSILGQVAPEHVA